MSQNQAFFPEQLYEQYVSLYERADLVGKRYFAVLNKLTSQVMRIGRLGISGIGQTFNSMILLEIKTPG